MKNPPPFMLARLRRRADPVAEPASDGAVGAPALGGEGRSTLTAEDWGGEKGGGWVREIREGRSTFTAEDWGGGRRVGG